MLTLNSFPNKKLGEIHKQNSDLIMEMTWYTDIASKEAYMYDYFHDNHIQQITKLEPQFDENKTKVDVKFFRSAAQSFDKDTVTFRIQFKPNFEYIDTDLSYYQEMYENIYDSIFPIGMYIDIPNEQGVYNKWLVVGIANYYNNQFPTYEVLPVNHILQYIIDGIKYEVPAVLRSQNSYNSGEWVEYRTTSIEDQQKFIVPVNRETEKLYNNQRLLIDAKVKTEPRAWRISKINRINPKGTIISTLVQDHFNQHNDYIELDEFDNVIGMWADYYSSPILPKDFEKDTTHISTIRSEIKYSGLKSELKVGGLYKTFTVNYYDGDTPINFESDGTWNYVLDGIDITSDISNYLDIVILSDNQFKIKFLDKNEYDSNQKYIGKILTLTYSSANAECSLDIAIVSL